MVKLFLDDLRPTPKDFQRVYTYDEFVAFITVHGIPTYISFDHDLGPGKTGYDCAKFLVDYCLDHDITNINFSVHSQNPVGKQNIEGLLNNFNNRT